MGHLLVKMNFHFRISGKWHHEKLSTHFGTRANIAILRNILKAKRNIVHIITNALPNLLLYHLQKHAAQKSMYASICCAICLTSNMADREQKRVKIVTLVDHTMKT